jgi:hypothetical protein
MAEELQERCVTSKIGSLGSWLGKVEKTVAADVTKVKAEVNKGLKTAKEAFLEPLLHKQDSFQPSVELEDRGAAKFLKPKGPLVAGGINAADVRQGATGDCYFLSSLAAVAQTHPDLIQKAIKANPDGTFTVTFHEPAGFDFLRRGGAVGNAAEGVIERTLEKVGMKPADKTVSVTVDGTLPMENGRTVYAHPDTLGETWPAVMEKAYAKLWGGYGAIGNGGDGGAALLALTGQPVKRYSLSPSKADDAFATLKSVLASGQPIVAGTKSHVTSPLVHSGHDYTVLGVSEEKGQKFVTVRNPWGHEAAGTPGAADGVHKLPLETFLANYQYADYATAK